MRFDTLEWLQLQQKFIAAQQLAYNQGFTTSARQIGLGAADAFHDWLIP